MKFTVACGRWAVGRVAGEEVDPVEVRCLDRAGRILEVEREPDVRRAQRHR
jgi:hypothetical protein